MDRIDSHLHLSGCISPAFVWETIKANNMTYLASNEQEVIEQMTFSTDEPKTFTRFLNKFALVDQLPWSESLIDSAIKDATSYLLNDSIDYAWISLSIYKFMKIGWHKKEAILHISDCFRRHANGKVGMVLALKYESSKAGQRQHASLIEDPDVASVLTGIDLIGDEAYFDSSLYADILKPWLRAGKMVRAHAGETQPVENVKHAIDVVGVTNIAHGLRVIDDLDVIKMAKDKDVAFDLSLNSNSYTGVWPNEAWHPVLSMLDCGLNVTVGSDDPIQFNNSLTKEYERLHKIGVSPSQVETIRSNGIKNVKRFLCV